jgi:hypothetical protein
MDGGESSATDEDAREIPMPKDVQNMPPMPRRRKEQQRPQNAVPATSANNTPLGGGGRADYRADYRAEQLQRRGERAGATTTAAAAAGEDLHQQQERQESMGGQRHALPAKPAAAQTVYSAAPQIRNLQKEAVNAFVPSSVAQKIAAAKGAGARLVEPEEADRLEREGYMAAAADNAVQQAASEAEKELEYGLMAREEVEGAADGLEEEERRFAREVRRVEIEEVEDEDL